MAIEKDLYELWRGNPVTKAFFDDAAEATSGWAAHILNRREKNPDDDQFCKGVIHGISSCVDWQPEIVDRENEDD